MLKELINFTNSLPDNFKSLGAMPKEGLHILLQVDDKGNLNIKSENIQFGFYSKKLKDELSAVLEKCKRLQENAWCVNTNKCFDLPMKAIQSCSPICVAFKKEHIQGGVKYKSNLDKGKPQIQERFSDYFDKAESMLTEDEILKKASLNFQTFFLNKSWEIVLNDIKNQRDAQFQILSNKVEALKERQKSVSDKTEKDSLKQQITDAQTQMTHFQPLTDSDYILFYLDFPLETYKTTHGKYLGDKLFNTDKYNTDPNEEGLIYGTNDFQNGYNANMPFLMHQTATFDITGRISNLEAKALYEFSNVLPRKNLPNPLPIFIFNEEFKKKVIAAYSEKRISFTEIVKELYNVYKDDFRNYYLLNWSNTQNGIVFNDFDFVSQFQFEVGGTNKWLHIENLFNLYEDGKPKHYPIITDIFHLEEKVLKYLVRNKYHKVDYFSDFKKEDYASRDFTFLSFCKYRKAIYDYVYKSNRATIHGKQFDELVFNGIKDDLHNSSEHGIKNKLNIWYSLHNYFHKSNTKTNNTMANKLKEHQNFVATLIEETAETALATDNDFAFAAGQVIYYLINKSKSEDNSLRLLEPYLQKSNCREFQLTITKDLERYKHEKFSRNFSKVAAFVLAHNTEENVKNLHPELLSGLFSDNQLYSNNNKND
ncbi:hypothetical protein [Arenibacter certesii]|uniref:CRISPR-associated protein Csh1 n=1 Tax=Arenibacter certesii TaxID=228955 RepID=A0A918IXG9_9FLAO|nr:hypothetical protein [Arenibacter certesii]GGW36669.1 hypothetical protein GCM10007383_22050 [Arenibacter certesii]